MMASITLGKTTVQDDKVNKANPNDDFGELKHWKRVILHLHITDNQGAYDAEVRLELRARNLQVDAKKSNRNPRPIALTLIHHMCEFAMQPRIDLFHEIQSGGNISEWIVADGVHVSGLLHRVAELKQLSDKPTPPTPGPIRARLKLLLADIKGNLKAMEDWNQKAVTNGQPVYGLFFYNSSWESFGSSVVHSLEDQEVIRDLTTFFELSKAYAVAVPEAMKNWTGRTPQITTASILDRPSSWSFFTYNLSTATQAGNRLLAKLPHLIGSP